MKKTPDIFLSQEFEVPNFKKNFNDYLDYVFNESKTETKVYESYHDYMYNLEKTNSIFTKEKDFLDEMEIKKQKEIFSLAQEKGSFLWKPVISFNNEFLRKNKILIDDKINDKKLKECARKSIEKMFELENINNFIYSCAIHYNTDNIHIHLAAVEVGTPTRKYIDDKKLTKKERCKNAFFKKSTFEKGKSVVSSVLSNDLENLKELNFLSRKQIVEKINFKNKTFTSEEVGLLKEILEKLPKNKNLWQYNHKSCKYVKPLINKFVVNFLYNNFSEEMKNYKKELKEVENLYTKRYGSGKYEHNSYAKNKLDELYTRSANKVLKVLKTSNLNFENISLDKPLDTVSNKKQELNEVFNIKEKTFSSEDKIDRGSNAEKENFLSEDKKLEIYFFLLQEKIDELKKQKQEEIKADEKLKRMYLENNKNLDTKNLDVARHQISLFTCFKNMFFNFEETLQEESFHNLENYRKLEQETRIEKKKSLERSK